AERRGEPRLVGDLHHLVVAQHRLHGRRKRRRHEVGGGGAQHIELARLLLDGDRRGVANVWHHEIQQPPHALLEVERGAELVARVREEIRAPPRLLGRGPRHLGFGQDVGFFLVHRASGAATLSARTAYARGRPAWRGSPRRRRQYISHGRPSWLSP